MTDSWFRADVFFDCPFCHKRSTESIIVGADRHDPVAVAEGIRKAAHPLTCQNCKRQAPHGTKTQIGINDLTPEELAKINLNPGSKLM